MEVPYNGVMDASSIIVRAIAGLCANGVPQEKWPYFNERIYPLLASITEFLLEHMPEEPDLALAMWMMNRLDIPPRLAQPIEEWLGIAPESDTSLKSCLAESKGISLGGRTKRGSAAFVTPSGHALSEDMLRRVVPLTDEQKNQYISRVPSFADLGPKDMKTVTKAFDLIKYLDGEEIQKTGASGAGMHIVVRGEGKVSIVQEIGTVKAGDIFGEEEMVAGVPAIQSIEACNGPMTTLHLSGLSFKALGLKRKVGLLKRKKAAKGYDHTIAGRRQSAGGVPQGPAPPEECPAGEDLAMIKEAITNNQNIMEVLRLNENQISEVANDARKEVYEPGQIVFQKGDHGDHFCIVSEGVFQLVNVDLQDKPIKIYARGSFGELGLMYNAPRAATVSCHKRGTIWKIARSTFKHSMRTRMEGKILEYSELTSKVALFQNQSHANMQMLCNALEEQYFVMNETIVNQGDTGASFFIVYAGTCCVEVDGCQQPGGLGRGDFFGERALLHNEVRAASIRVTSDTCTVLVLDRVSFNLLVGSASDGEVDMSTRRRTVQNLGGKMKKLMIDEIKKEKIRLADLQRIGILGRGAFGFVTLERSQFTGKLYALKAMSKGHIVQERLKAMVVNEKECMELSDSQWVVQLYGFSYDAQNIYLILEPSFGGELFDLYAADTDLFGSETHARFYAACVSQGLDHLHSRRIVYRDLKLENCLLGLDGYLKLTDLGIAKVVVGKTYTVCGTTDYFAPETLRQTGHNRAVDWWALGVMLYIMMAGRSPFEAVDTMTVYRKITKGFAKVAWPDGFPEKCVSIIKGLCQKNPEERLTMGNLGVSNFKDHPWYREFVWKQLDQRTMPAPWCPQTREEDIMTKAANKVVEALPDIPYEDDGDTWYHAFAET